MEPDVLIGREEPGELWSDHANEVSQHRDEDEGTIEGEDKTRASRSPNGELQGVEARKFWVGSLCKRRSVVVLLPGNDGKWGLTCAYHP